MKCPHCQSNSVSAWSKYWSGSTSPAYCKKCEEPSYIHSKHVRLGDFIEYGVALISITVAFYTSSIFPLIAIALTFIVIELSVLLYAPLLPSSHEKVLNNKKWGNIFLLLLALLIVIAVLSA